MQITEFGPKYMKEEHHQGTKCADLTLKKVGWKHFKCDLNTRIKTQLGMWIYMLCARLLYQQVRIILQKLTTYTK